MNVERRGTKALELWAKKATQGYAGVSVENMTTSWRNGLAFCALIHHFRPDLIAFDSLKAENVLENNALAYRVAEQHLGIPALLDAEDMLESLVPDRLSILTYVSQFYQAFGSPIVRKSPVVQSTKTNSPLTPQKTPISSPIIVTAKAKQTIVPSKKEADFKTDKVATGSFRVKREDCHECQKPVFIAERILVGSPIQLRHRTCFRCARCTTQLTLANYYVTEKGQLCCETCPDEEKSLSSECSKTGPESSSDSDSDSSSPDNSINASLSSAADQSTFGERVMEARPRTIFLNDTANNPDTPEPIKDEGISILVESAPEKPPRSHFLHDTPSEVVIEQSNKCANSTVTNRLKFFEQKCQPQENCINRSSLQSELKLDTDVDKNTTNNDISQDDALSLKENKEDSMKNTDQDVVTAIENGEKSQKNTKQDAISVIENDDKSVNNIKEDPVNEMGNDDKFIKDNKDDHINVTESEEKSLKEYKDDHINVTESDEKSLKEYKDIHINVTDSDEKSLKDYKDDPINITESEEKSIKDNKDDPINVTESEEKSIKDNKDDPINITESEKKSIKDDKDDVVSVIDSEENSVQITKEEMYIEDSTIESPDKFNSEQPTDQPQEMVDNNNGTKENMPIGGDLPTTEEENLSLSTQINEESIKTEYKIYPGDLNPFGSDEKQEVLDGSKALNPFGSSDEEKEKSENVKESFKKNLNPFWSDEEECVLNFPQTPSKSKSPPPRPPPPTLKRNEVPHGKISSIYSSKFDKTESFPPSPALSSRSTTPDVSTVRLKKKHKPAPVPPSSGNRNMDMDRNLEKCLNDNQQNMSKEGCDDVLSSKIEKEKRNQSSKLKENVIERKNTHDSKHVVNAKKLESGEWKRKKGPAPPRPVPQKRTIRALPLSRIQLELVDIEVKQTELERQGVIMETLIRSKTETPSDESPCSTTSEMDRCSMISEASHPGVEVEDLILQLFELVNEKNELFRRQTELMYLKREKRLEEEHAELEFEIRCLLLKPNRTESEIRQEEILIARLMKVVEQRDQVVNCLELERQREAVEDESIATHMIKYQEKYIEGIDSNEEVKRKKKKKKLRLLKKKKKKTENGSPQDADKDIDETEVNVLKKKKKKWFKKVEFRPS